MTCASIRTMALDPFGIYTFKEANKTNKRIQRKRNEINIQVVIEIEINTQIENLLQSLNWKRFNFNRWLLFVIFFSRYCQCHSWNVWVYIFTLLLTLKAVEVLTLLSCSTVTKSQNKLSIVWSYWMVCVCFLVLWWRLVFVYL